MKESMPSSAQPPHAAQNPRTWLAVSGVAPVALVTVMCVRVYRDAGAARATRNARRRRADAGAGARARGARARRRLCRAGEFCLLDPLPRVGGWVERRRR